MKNKIFYEKFKKTLNYTVLSFFRTFIAYSSFIQQIMIKQLFLSLILLLSLAACRKQDAYLVGRQNDGVLTVNEDIEKVKQYFIEVMEQFQLHYELVEYQIIKAEDKQTGAPFYMLVGSTYDGSAHMAIEVFESGADIALTSASLTGRVVICQSSCPDGCMPTKTAGTWTCESFCINPCPMINARAYEFNNYTTPIQAFLERY